MDGFNSRMAITKKKSILKQVNLKINQQKSSNLNKRKGID